MQNYILRETAGMIRELVQNTLIPVILNHISREYVLHEIFFFSEEELNYRKPIMTTGMGRPDEPAHAPFRRSIYDQRKIPLHLFTIGFQKPGICADSWLLESNGKKVQRYFSLINN